MTFAQWLEYNGACKEARDWIGNRGLAWMWKHCTRPQWMKWLLYWAARYSWGDSWPSDAAISELEDKLKVEFKNSSRLWDYRRGDLRQFPRMCDFIRQHAKPGLASDLR